MKQRNHVEEVTSGHHAYRIEMGGTIDGENTRSPVGYQVYDQAFEPNLYVRIENAGETPLKDAWLIANGQDWRTLESIVEGVVASDMDDAEKALALWDFQRHHRFHATTNDRDNQDPVKMLNVYGYTLCGDDCHVLADLWRAAGLKEVRAGHPVGHSTSEVTYDGMWHLLDGDEHAIYLMRDNRTIAGEVEIVRDHDLIKRTHVYGVLKQEDRTTNESAASCFYYEGERGEARVSHTGHRMGLNLRPGEALEWRWDSRGKFHGRRNMGLWRNAWTRICNGSLIYTPDLGSDLWRYGAVEVENVEAEGGLRGAGGGEAAAVFEVRSPYAIAGGAIRARFRRGSLDERVALAFSIDREEWTEVWMAGELGEVTAEVSLDRYFGEMYYAWDRQIRKPVPTEGEARYGYYVRVSLQGAGAGIDALTLESDLQMAPLSLPGVRLGDNRMVYVDETAGPRRVQITHAWRESSTSRPPPSPDRPVCPEDGANVEGTRFTFAWSPVEGPDGRGIVDYHFQLSARADMKYVLSPNFEKLTARTAQGGAAHYEIPFEGLINPGETYFWRVRARNEAGVWSRWSPVWRFVPQGPGVPLDLRLEADGVSATLFWRPNPEGRRPVRYEVYGSNEKGFTASDAPYRVLVGPGKQEKVPANLIGCVEGTELQVVGVGLDLPNTNRAYYRVAAVDENGVRSGVSDYAEAPRPLICSRPVETAKAGEPYRYAAKVVKSIGDLRRMRSGDRGYWRPMFCGEDALTYVLEDAPEWLSIDGQGVISGCPTAEGDVRVRLKVTREQGGEDVQSYVLKVTG